MERIGVLGAGAWGTALAALAAAGISAERIGGMVKPEAGVIMMAQARSVAVPRFARDEVARFLTG